MISKSSPTVALKYQWDLSFIFKNNSDWEQALKECYKLGDNLVKKAQQLTNADQFYAFKQAEEQLNKRLLRLASYLNLLNLDLTNTQLVAMQQTFFTYCQKLSADLAFVSPKIKKLGHSQIMRWIADIKQLQPYKYEYELFFKQARYILDVKTEKLIAQLSGSRQFCSSIYEKLVYADKKPVFIQYKGQKQELTPKIYAEIMEHTNPQADQTFRRKTERLFNCEFIAKKHSLAATYEAIMRRARENVEVRGFESTLASFLADDEVPLKIYHNLIEQAKSRADLVRRYFRLHQKHTGLVKYFSSDSRIKLVKIAKVSYSVDLAQRLIKNSLQPLGSQYQQQLHDAWRPGRIDYFPANNKQQGAYSTGGGDIKPIILLNWDDSLRSVSTLAHETGHSVHTIFAAAYQRYPLYEYPIILAEIASTINEQLLFNYLIARATTTNHKIWLLQQQIEDMIGTFFRQVMFADFEQQAHKLVAQKMPVTAELLAKLFKTTSHAYGYDVFTESEDDVKFAWTRVSHFFQSPFYVYKYATSIAVALFFYHDVQTKGPANFIKFLKAGGHKPPLDILTDYGVDLADPQLYVVFFERLADLISQLEHYLTVAK